MTLCTILWLYWGQKSLGLIHHVIVLHALVLSLLGEFLLIPHTAASFSLLLIRSDITLNTRMPGFSFYWSILPSYDLLTTVRPNVGIFPATFVVDLIFAFLHGLWFVYVWLILRICAIIVRFIFIPLLSLKLGRINTCQTRNLSHSAGCSLYAYLLVLIAAAASLLLRLILLSVCSLFLTATCRIVHLCISQTLQ